MTAVVCGSLTDPANGRVDHTAGTTFRQTATYSCNTGYSLVGDSTRTCQATGIWSGSEPACQGVYVYKLINPLLSNGDAHGVLWHHLTFAGCYKFVLKIGFVLAKELGRKRWAGFSMGYHPHGWLPWLAVEWPWLSVTTKTKVTH